MNTIKLKHIFRSGIFLLMIALLFGCTSQSESSDADTTLLTELQKEAIEREREEMLTMIRDNLKAANQKIDSINQKVLEEGTEAALEVESAYAKALKELDTYREDLETKIQEVENATEENWHQFKTDVDPYRHKMKTDLDTLSSQIEKILSEEKK
jgi:predicted nucleotide-binding protein (sugar kinase/HSP70/actin superfamily)